MNNENKIPSVEFLVKTGIMTGKLEFLKNHKGEWNWCYQDFAPWELVEVQPFEVDFSSEEEAVKGFIQSAITHYFEHLRAMADPCD